MEPVVDARQKASRVVRVERRSGHSGPECCHVGGDRRIGDGGFYRIDEVVDPGGRKDGREVDDAVTPEGGDLAGSDRPKRVGGGTRHGSGCYSSSSGAAAGASSSAAGVSSGAAAGASSAAAGVSSGGN